MQAGRTLACGLAPTARSHSGTTCRVRDFMFNQPVRRRSALQECAPRSPEPQRSKENTFDLYFYAAMAMRVCTLRVDGVGCRSTRKVERAVYSRLLALVLVHPHVAFVLRVLAADELGGKRTLLHAPAVRSPERSHGFRREADARSFTHTLHSSPHPLSLHLPHHPTAASAPSSSARGLS
jgi:hypothetical protein